MIGLQGVLPRVSICMPTYNRADFIGVTINTILNQTYSNFELIISDDNSTDNTKEVVESFQDSRVRYYRNNSNLKMPGNLNQAIRLARGELIVIFHDHDLYHPTVVGSMVDMLEQNENIGFVHTAINWKNVDTQELTEIIGPWKPITPGKKLFDEILNQWECPICALTMVRKSSYEEVGLYDESFGFISDVDMWLRLCLKYDVGYIAEPLITCLERDSDHPYAVFKWDIPRWNISLHDDNFNRRYRDPTPANKIKFFAYSIRKNYFLMRLMLFLIYKRDVKNIHEGMKVISKNCYKALYLLLSLLTYFFDIFYIQNKFPIIKSVVIKLFLLNRKKKHNSQYKKLWHDTLKIYLKGKGLRIGGSVPGTPKNLNVDDINVVVNYAGSYTETVLIQDGHDMFNIGDSAYCYLVNSHVVEHSPNPIKLLVEFIRVIKVGGYIYTIIPNKEKIYDAVRCITKMDHLIDDYQRCIFTEDLTHHEEYLQMVSQNPGMEAFHKIYPVGYPYIHYHTFDCALARNLFEHLQLEVLLIAEINENMCILSRVTIKSKEWVTR